MDFVVGLPKTSGRFDFIWVVVDRLTKSNHFILIRVDFNADVKEMRLHGVPLSIISACGTLFISMFWKNLHDELGTHEIHLQYNLSFLDRLTIVKDYSSVGKHFESLNDGH